MPRRGKFCGATKEVFRIRQHYKKFQKVLPYENKLIVGFADGHLVALNRDEGLVVWEQKLSRAKKFLDVDADPIYFNGHIVAGSSAGDLRFIDPNNGIVKRTINVVVGHTPLKNGQEIIVGSIFGKVYRISSEGEIIHQSTVSKAGISSIVPWKGGIVSLHNGWKYISIK